MSPPSRVALLGFGEVGQAFARRLARGDLPFEVVSITDRRGSEHDAGGIDLAAALAAKAGRSPAAHRWDWGEALRRVEADVVVDALPTDLRTGARELAVARCGLPVVTAAKGALAWHARSLRGLDYHASAAVCGGTPALELLSNAFRGDVLERFEGVLNGSTNHILSRIEEGDTWDQAVTDARERGILESDPSLDLLGLDAAAKAVILANRAWGTCLTLGDVQTRGIVGIDAAEVLRARSEGMAVRLVARASVELGVAVGPATLERGHALAVAGKENALRLKFRDAGWVTLRGPGAGGQETAAALVSDLLAVAARGGTRLPVPRVA